MAMDGKAVERSATGVAAATIGSAVAPYLGPEIATMLTAALNPFFDHVAELGNRRALQAFHRSTELADVSPEDLARWGGQSPNHAALMVQVADAAWRSADEAHIEGLARVLAESIHDDARLDLAPLYVSALRDLEPAHVRVLNSMASDINAADDFEGKEVGSSGEWATEHLATKHEHLSDGLHAILATLDRVGCIARGNSRFGGAVWWGVTPFGHGCLGYLVGDGLP